MYIALALFVGLVVGVAIGWWVSPRRTTESGPVSPAPTVTAPPSSTDLLSDAIKHLDIGIVVSSKAGAVLYRNDSADAMRGTHLGVLVDEQVETDLGRARRGERSSRVVELHGPPRSWLALTAEPLPNGAAVVTIQDVSERMRTDAMRTDFVTNISHELKTPVGAIAVLADALEGEDDVEVLRRLVGRIGAEAERAVQTIDDLLRLSNFEAAGRGDEVVDLASVVQAAISRGRIVDEGRGVDVMAIEPSEPIRVLADRSQLVSAVGNLVENAVKYSNGGGVVQIRSRISDTAIEIMVADQGIGIPTRDIDRIFERFYRVDKARSRDTGGTGLGLSIVRHVASNHGGEVLVSSQEGQGSTFVLRLPISILVRSGAELK
jgi:two-component system, OmpR family, sensor histidine kinase SenX3